jgi:hypothetical protein
MQLQESRPFNPGSFSAESGRSSDTRSIEDRAQKIEDDSETSSSDSEVGMGYRLKSNIETLTRHVGKNNIPFPCLGGARFSFSGTLVYFTSPLPHPSASKFSSFSVSTRNMQPILQTQQLRTHPKSYPLYEQYRAFLLSKYPRQALHHSLEVRDRSLDMWLDDEEEDDEEPDAVSSRLFWRGTKAEDLANFDFLKKLAERQRESKHELLKNDFYIAEDDIPGRKRSASLLSSELSDRDWSDAGNNL